MVVCCSFACIVLYCLSEVSTILSTISGDGHVSTTARGAWQKVWLAP